MQQNDYHASVNIVTWNSEEYIDDLLKSLEAQSFRDFYIIVIDNNSTDKTLEIAQKYPRVTLLRNSSNTGFSRAHNKGIDLALKFWKDKALDDRFIFTVNPDIVLKEDCIEKMLKSIYKEKDTAIMGLKLLRIYEEEIDNLPHKSKSNIIDSLGIEIYKSRKATDRFAGKEAIGPSLGKSDGEKPDLNKQEVFGVSGAFMCLRASALESIKWGKEYFDEDFFAYKEDVDLCWRLKNMGWKIMISPEAVAYHYRKVRGDAKMSLRKKFQNQRYKSSAVKFLSARNHLWTILKNDFVVNHFLHCPFIFFREAGKFIYTLLLDTKNIQAYFSAIKGIPKMLRKRKYLQNAKASAKEIRKFMK